MRDLARLAAGAALALTAAAPAAAETAVTLSLWVSPKHPVAVGGYDPLVEKLKSQGDEYDVQYFTGGALLGAKPILSGLSDGIADVGMMAMTYFPAEFPNAQLVADMGLATPSNLSAMMAASEFNLLHCPGCLEEYYNQDIVYTGTYSTSPYAIISNEPIKSVEDLKGKKMRVPGSLWSRWADSVGGVQVNVPSSEMYEGLDKGALDIAIQAPGALRSYSLWDTAGYLTNLNLGTYHSLSLMSFNRDLWREFTPEQRRMMLDEAARAGVDATLEYTKTDEEVLAQAEEKGVQVIDAPQGMLDQKQQFVEKDISTIVALAEEQGVEDARAKVEKLQELIDKWDRVATEIGDDRDALVARFREDVYDKLPDDYGL